MQRLLHSSAVSRYTALPLAAQPHTAQPGPLPSHQAAREAASQSGASLSLLTALFSVCVRGWYLSVGSVGTAFLVAETEQDLAH